MEHPLQLNISNPCDQDWNQMTPSGMGRNCAQCQKTVIDFSDWSDAALLHYFANTNSKVCGRFLKIQVNRPIVIPHQPHSRLYSLTIALGLTLMFTQVPDAMAQYRPPKAQQALVRQSGVGTTAKPGLKQTHKAKAKKRQKPPNESEFIKGELVNPTVVESDTVQSKL